MYSLLLKFWKSTLLYLLCLLPSDPSFTGIFSTGYCGNFWLLPVWNSRDKINPKSCPVRMLYCEHTLKWVATEGNGVHHTAVKLQLFQIILAWWLTTARLNSQVSFFYPIFVVLFCKLKHKTKIFRTRNNSVSQLCRVAEDWSVLCLLVWPGSVAGEWDRAALYLPARVVMCPTVLLPGPITALLLFARTNQSRCATDLLSAANAAQLGCVSSPPSDLISLISWQSIILVSRLRISFASWKFISLTAITTTTTISPPSNFLNPLRTWLHSLAVKLFVSSTVVSDNYNPTCQLSSQWPRWRGR